MDISDGVSFSWPDGLTVRFEGWNDHRVRVTRCRHEHTGLVVNGFHYVDACRYCMSAPIWAAAWVN